MHRRQKEFLRKLRRPFEWAGIGFGLLVFANLPRRALLAVCDFASAVMYACDRRGRALSLRNLRIVLRGEAGNVSRHPGFPSCRTGTGAGPWPVLSARCG